MSLMMHTSTMLRRIRNTNLIRTRLLSTATATPTATPTATATATTSAGRFVSVISTASRGIGLEFTKQILSSSTCPLGRNAHVIALCRNATTALLALKEDFPSRLEIIEGIDLEDPDSINAISEIVKDRTDRVDLLLNVAGILGDGLTVDEGPERSISKISYPWMMKSMQLNLMGHVMMTQALFPLLISAAKSKTETALPPRVINISARVGSISDNGLGGWYSYRMSKAALNQFTKTFSLEAKRFSVIALALHPGTTDTDLSKPFQARVKPEKLFSVEYSVSNMLDVIANASLNDSGQFLAYDGSKIEY
jgi:NAD(P)-dependent dehydrogenase (short-subunit alcohol dehydrogenase family)